MSKWQSETTGLESKEQLKSYRKDKWKGLLLQNNLDLDLYPWWTDEEKELEEKLWEEADKDYEKRKEDLSKALHKLEALKLPIYFQEIGVENQDIGVWLKLKR